MLRYYFQHGYDYNTIMDFLAKFHDILISRRTLFNRLKKYGLRRRGCEGDVNLIRELIRRELDGYGSLLGYRAVWKRLRSKYGIEVPRLIVQKLLKELDPEGSKHRKAHCLQRRAYLNPGPNFCWHIDGYDKLKPYGFPIHGCIDGFSRRILWLKVTKSNNDPRIICNFFMDCVKTAEGTPKLFRTDRGTENGLAAAAQCYLRRNGNDALSGVKAHQYGSSHSNQRVEAWWCMLRRSWSSWWINYFKDLVDSGRLDTSNKIHIECLWYCFYDILQRELDEVKESWNSHYIRASRHYTCHGIPNKLYFTPESVGVDDHKEPGVLSDILTIENEVTVPATDDSSAQYQEYFEYALNELALSQPQNWRTAQIIYEKLVLVGE